MKKTKRIKKLLKATVDYNKGIALSYFKKEFYIHEQDRIKNIFNNYLLKQKYSAPHTLPVDLLIEKFMEMAKETEIKIFKVLINIRDKSIKEIKTNRNNLIKEGYKYNNLINIISNPFILSSAYRTLRSKEGAMTPAYPLPKYIIKQLNPEQIEFVNRTYDFPDSITWEDLVTIGEFIKKEKYPWGQGEDKYTFQNQEKKQTQDP